NAVRKIGIVDRVTAVSAEIIVGVTEIFQIAFELLFHLESAVIRTDSNRTLRLRSVFAGSIEFDVALFRHIARERRDDGIRSYLDLRAIRHSAQVVFGDNTFYRFVDYSLRRRWRGIYLRSDIYNSGLRRGALLIHRGC